MDLQKVSNAIEIIVDFPKRDIIFRNVAPCLSDYAMRIYIMKQMANLVKNEIIDYVVGIDARGFIFGTGIADILKCGFIMARKPGKIPNVLTETYGLEYGENTLCMQMDAIPKGSNVLIVDDLIATGGSFGAVVSLIKRLECNVVACIAMIELISEKPRVTTMDGIKVLSLLSFPINSATKNVVHNVPVEYIPLVPYADCYNNFSNQKYLSKDIVFYHPSMKSLAQQFVTGSDNYRLGGINWDFFADGQPNIKFEHLKYLENKRIVFFMSTMDRNHLLEQLSMLMILPRQLITSLDIIIPYYAVATMERVDEEGSLATAETFAKILSSCIPMTKSGVPIVHVFDIHALPIRFYPTDNVFMKLESGISLLKEKVDKETIFCFPDSGAYTRFNSSFKGRKIIICSKIREGDTRTIRIIDRKNFPKTEEEDLSTEIVIVDDLVQSGSTLEECRKALSSIGYTKVSAYVTHPVFPNRGYIKFLTSKGGKFHKFYTTNSIPEVSDILVGKSPFEVLNLKDEILFSLNKSAKIDRQSIIDVYVASTNKMKLQAVHEFFTENSRGIYNIHGVDCSSDIANQPVGEQETMLGCKNRLSKLSPYYHKGICVSIENGIIVDDEQVYDTCAVAMTSFGTRVCCSFSDIKAYFPMEYYTRSVESHKQDITAGSLIENELGLLPGMWHNHFGYDRIDMMKDGLGRTNRQI